MLPMTHHKIRPQSTPIKKNRSQQKKPRSARRRTCFTVADALLQVASGDLKNRETIRLVISLAANEDGIEEGAESLGTIAGQAGCQKTDNPYDQKSQRKLFAAFERGLKIGQTAAKSVRASKSRAGKSTRRKNLH